MIDQVQILPQIAILTAFGAEWGSGHYCRSVDLSHLWDTHFVTRYVFCPSPSLTPVSSDSYPEICDSQVHSLVRLILLQKTTVLIIDRREFAAPWISFLEKQANIRCVLFDSIGPQRSFASLLIDAIPSLSDNLPSNLRGSQYLPFEKTSLQKKSPKKSGVSAFFGFSDSKKLSKLLLSNLPSLKSFLPSSSGPLPVSVFVGNGNSSLYFLELQKIALTLDPLVFSVHILPQTPNFLEVLSSFQLLFCHYGITCFQAIQRQIPFILLPPSNYHLNLSLKHFPSLTASFQKSSILLPTSITCFEDLANSFVSISQNLSVGQSFLSIKPIVDAIASKIDLPACSVCNSKNTSITHRKPHGNFYLCSICKNISLKELFPIEILDPSLKIHYDQDYFLHEYQLSYGKTYQQDKQTISLHSLNRVNIIKNYLPSENPPGKILDIGCALGYFLDQAKNSGFQTFGVEISQFAANIAKKNHSIFQSDFLNTHFSLYFDVISLWYVIEHFPHPAEVIKKILSIHKKGGILAISTPNALGISSRGNPLDFFKNSPNDHFVVFSPHSLKKLCQKYGYRLLKVHNTGIHLNRVQKHFPTLYKFLPKKIIPSLINLLNLGDTFEIYLQKVI